MNKYNPLINEVGNIRRFFPDGYAVVRDGHLLNVHGFTDTINNARYYKHINAGLEFAKKHGGQLVAVRNLVLEVCQPINEPQIVEVL